MKKSTITVLFLLVLTGLQAIPPYYYFGALKNNPSEQIIKFLEQNEFNIIGTYNPMSDENFEVICFTSKQLIETTSKIKDRGLLAAVHKIAVISENGSSDIYLLNPEYIFWAYLRKEMDKSAVSDPLLKIDKKLKDMLSLIGTEANEFGGNESRSDLEGYRYMFGMEQFDDPVELKKFSSFQDGLTTITTNAEKSIGETKLVYKLIDENSKTAVFGIGLKDKNEGEPHFLPIIGSDHAAALPYEIILQGNEATMLHGRYRIALHWPELTMMTFSKIMSTPGEIKEQLEALCM